MTSPIRVRRHTDGRVALCFESDQYHWRISELSAVSGRMGFGGSELGPLGAGWSELFVAELPQPDYTVQWIACWDLHAGGEMTVDTETGELETPHLHTGEQARSDALKMLSAVAACEKYRAERETTT